MTRMPNLCAGSKSEVGVGLRTVPYEIAIERVLDSEEDSAAPTVPEDRAKAAVKRFVRPSKLADRTCEYQMCCGQDLAQKSSGLELQLG